jgi:hypothetical protein
MLKASPFILALAVSRLLAVDALEPLPSEESTRTGDQEVTSQAASSSASRVRDDLTLRRPGTNVTITLTNQKNVHGKVLAITESNLRLRVDRGFFRHRTDDYPFRRL